ncbi:sialate O-acetylesterase isoform X4 [Eptesicus fuscus]|uniref:sialate O-acetylesterase isoform X4 n=1 Tax=Eptesicus fuscus TaxID=29078 RepID=UPI0024042045|nr:sialate O-acetylesterase isoform X4 [Eptesicus fuscus]
MVALGVAVGLLLPLVLRAHMRAGAGFRFASYISDYMVLQKEPAGAVIWGYGISEATVTVTLCREQETIMKKVTHVTAHSNKWMVVLDPMKPGGPYEVMAQQTFGKMNLTVGVHDVLFGDVWLCSGQSNMQMTVSQIFNATRELADTAAYQSVRILSVSLNQAEQELEDLAEVDLQWSKPTAGEANVDLNRDLYNCTFPALIEDWRQTFHLGSQGQTERFLPFGFVQLSAVLSDEESDDRFSQIRWHQTADLGYVPNLRMPNTFMAVAMDLGDRNSPFGSIHPRDKQTVAYRLHLGARAVAYGEKTLTFQGPLPEKIERLADKGLLSLTYSQQIEVQRQDDKIFEISCCGDHQCKWLPAPMNTFSTQTLALNISSCPGAVTALRYAWASWPCEYKQCPLYHPNSTLPAPPFITFTAN